MGTIAQRSEGTISSPSDVMTLEETAEFMRISVRYLGLLSRSGVGPRYTKMGKQHRYLKATCLEWLAVMEGKDTLKMMKAAKVHPHLMGNLEELWEIAKNL